MDKIKLAALGPERLAELVLELGHIVRKLDEDCEYLEYWTQDGEYISDLAVYRRDSCRESGGR